jgi:hypothetical protein
VQTSVPEFIDQVLAKTSPQRSFSVIENQRFGQVFAKTGSINSGTVLSMGLCVCPTAVCSAPGSVMDFNSLLVNNFCYHFTCSLFPGKNAHKKCVLFRESGDAPTTTCIFWVCNPFGEDYLQKIPRCCQTIENIMHRK